VVAFRLSRVLLCERDPTLVTVLREFFSDEGVEVTTCDSLTDIEGALDQHPGAVVVTDSSWGDHAQSKLTPAERDALNRLGRRTSVIVTTGRSWASRAAEAGLGSTIHVLAKPYDVDDLLALVRKAREQAPT
jgi:DNA-binding NtrC family response regulator